MAVPANIIVAWPSTEASIPSGWSREIALDARYILGAAPGANTDLSTDRGNTTHVHTSPPHTPTQNSHTHTFSGDAGASLSLLTGTVAGTGPDVAHGHAAATSSTTTATNNSSTITVDPTSNDLAYTEVIWIKSDGNPTSLPNGCYAFFASDSLPSGWSRVNGDRYLKGAAAASNPAAPGGSNTHSHTSPAHTHTQNPHSHTGTSGVLDLVDSGRGTGADTISTSVHTHAVTLLSGTPTNQSVTTAIDPSNSEPPFTKLNTILSSSSDLPTNIITLWGGTNSGIPPGWSRFTAMDSRWLKGAALAGQSGIDTGGSSQHTHTAANCQPTQNAHTHTITDPGPTGSVSAAPGTSATFAVPTHTHTWTCSTDTPTNNSVSVSIDQCTADAALPKHRTVIFVQFTAPVIPPKKDDVYTSYGLGLFDLEEIAGRVLPEVAKKIAQGDLRYVPR